MDSKHKGARSELVATVWLLERGYEVFRNVSQHGIIDLIARDPETGEIRLFDVKTVARYVKQDGSVSRKTAPLSEDQLKCDVRLIAVDGNECFPSDLECPTEPI